MCHRAKAMYPIINYPTSDRLPPPTGSSCSCLIKSNQRPAVVFPRLRFAVPAPALYLQDSLLPLSLLLVTRVYILYCPHPSAKSKTKVVSPSLSPQRTKLPCDGLQGSCHESQGDEAERWNKPCWRVLLWGALTLRRAKWSFGMVEDNQELVFLFLSIFGVFLA